MKPPFDGTDRTTICDGCRNETDPTDWKPWKVEKCVVCNGGFSEKSWDDRHTHPQTGGDCHARCCPRCKKNARAAKAEQADAENVRFATVSARLKASHVVNAALRKRVADAEACAEAIGVEMAALRIGLDESRRMFDAAARNAVALYRQGALDWNNKALPPDDNVLLNAGLQVMFDEPSPARDIEWHDQLSSVKAEVARLREQVAALSDEQDDVEAECERLREDLAIAQELARGNAEAEAVTIKQVIEATA